MKYLLLFALSLSASAQTNLTLTATVRYDVVTNWQEVGRFVPSNGAAHSSAKTGYLLTNIMASVEWNGQLHEIALEIRPGPSIGTYLFEPASLIMPPMPSLLPQSMPPPLPK